MRTASPGSDQAWSDSTTLEVMFRLDVLWSPSSETAGLVRLRRELIAGYPWSYSATLDVTDCSFVMMVMMVMMIKVMAATMTRRRVHEDSKQNRWRLRNMPRTETRRRLAVKFERGRRCWEQQEEALGGWTVLESRHVYPCSSRSCTHRLVTLFLAFCFFATRLAS